MDKQIYAMIGVDMETDVGSFTPFYEGTKHGTPKLIQLFQQKGIKGTFYFTGDCAKKNPKVAEMVLNSGNEIGCHSLYHETVGDELFPIPNEHPLLPHEVMPRIRLATQWIEDIAGVRPVSFRSPRLFGSTAVVNALEELGYVTDASYPMYFYRQRFFPYHPSRDDWTKEGNLRILELPNFADMTMKSQDPGIERDRDQWPLFRTKGSEYILQRIKSFIEFCNANSVPRFLCF
jgi:peptidoglycan/xylan/chitin deacetylase (PgdA/CDA1 family)